MSIRNNAYVKSTAHHLRGLAFVVKSTDGTHAECAEVEQVDYQPTGDIRRLLVAELEEFCPNHPGYGDMDCHVARERAARARKVTELVEGRYTLPWDKLTLAERATRRQFEARWHESRQDEAHWSR